MKIGVIGLGSIGARHAGTLVGLGHFVIGNDVAIVANAPVPLTPLKKLIADADAVVIASPTHLHAQHLREVLKLHKPVFVEKPVAHEYDPAFEKATMVGFNLRFHACVLKAKEWLDAGDIGKPLWANLTIAQHSDKPAYLRDGVISNWASHEIDLALFLLGPAMARSATARITDGHDDIADIVMRHDSGCQTVIHADYVTKPEMRQTLIVGDNGSIVADLVNRHAWLRDIDGGVIEHFEAADSFDSNYTDEMQAFIRRCAGADTAGATGADGLAALRVMLDARGMAGVCDPVAPNQYLGERFT